MLVVVVVVSMVTLLICNCHLTHNFFFCNNSAVDCSGIRGEDGYGVDSGGGGGQDGTGSFGQDDDLHLARVIALPLLHHSGDSGGGGNGDYGGGGSDNVLHLARVISLPLLHHSVQDQPPLNVTFYLFLSPGDNQCHEIQFFLMIFAKLYEY